MSCFSELNVRSQHIINVGDMFRPVAKTTRFSLLGNLQQMQNIAFLWGISILQNREFLPPKSVGRIFFYEEMEDTPEKWSILGC